MFNKYSILVLLFSSALTATITKSDPCTCTQIKEKADCLQNTDCQWSTSCTVKTNALITYCSTTSPCPISSGCAWYKELCTHFTGCTPYLEKTNALCQAISPKCTSDGTICINIANVCTDYTAVEGCRSDVNNNYCFWDETTTQCAQVETCEKLPISLITNAQCRTALSTCTSKGDGGCVVSGIDCKDQAEAGCFTNSNQTQDCFWDGTACKDKTCENAFQTLVSPIQCQQFLATCTVAETGSGCMTIPETCSGYKSEVQCTNISSKICFWDGTLCTEWTCEAAPITLTTHTQCQQFKEDCTVDADEIGCQSIKDTCESYTISVSCVITKTGSFCYWNGKKCTEQTCPNAALTTYTNDTCKDYLPICTNSTDGLKCTPRTCTTYSTEAYCSTDYLNRQCTWSGSCQVRTCANSYSIFISHQECVDWMPSCTISTTGKGCTTQSTDCTEYKVESQCVVAQNSTIQCVWTTAKTCVAKTCSTAALDLVTDDDCSNYLPSCTVNANGQGCMARKENCNDYNQLNCVKSTTKACYWDITKTPSCIIRECSQALLSTNLSCTNFLIGCTVNKDGTQCEVQKATCAEYLSSQQCVITTGGKKCIWNLKVSPTVCEDRTCENSDAVGSDAECAGHLSTCTVNVTKSACMTRLATCQGYTALVQCVSTLTNEPCYWYNNQCNQKTCDLAPKTYTTHAECQAYNVKCTTNSKGCQNLVNCVEITSKNSCVQGLDTSCSFVPNCQLQQCVDAPTYYTSDDQCKIFAPECTTNGQGCVKRGLCSDNYIEQACVTNSSGEKCAWINGICINYSCLSAPSYSTELECSLYMNGCTVNQSQGCISKTTCVEAKSQAACTTDALGNECEFSTLGCRDKICTDFNYSTHSECSSQNNTCTTDGIICVTQTKCQDKLTNTACLIGLDGPCLWVNSKCQLYLNCQSVSEITHTQCQLVSSNCTTDGTQCIPINQCKDTNQEGCFNGTDGLCVRTPPLLGGEVACAKFTTCNQVFYSTFEECQAANTSCTTDTLSCIDLAQCSTYKTSVGCQINSTKQKCFWSENTNTCDDLQCKDLVFTTHIECAAAKAECTTDQTVCIVATKCEEYLSEITCNVALGTQGLCLWDPTVTPPVCHAAVCADVTNCTTVTGCIDDGLKCVSIGLCSAYNTEKGCKQGGTDGVCVWTLQSGKGTCSVMTQCTDASSSQEACLKKSWACQWSVNAAGIGTCGQHTCGTKAKETGTCAPLLDFDQKSYEICISQNQLCITTDLLSLTSSTCFIGTGKLYTWDSNSCNQCNSVLTDNPDTGNGNGTTTPIQGVNGLMVTTFIVGLIVLI